MSIKAYERKQAITQKRILQAAVDLLIEAGYDRLTITAVADYADVGRGTVYRYFGDRDELVLHIFKQFYERIEIEANQRMADYESPQKEYIAWQIAFEHLQTLKPLFQNMHSPQAKVLWGRFEDYALQHFKASLERGQFLYPGWMGLPTDMMATFTAGAVLNVMRRWLTGELQYDAETLGAMVHQLLYHRPYVLNQINES